MRMDNTRETYKRAVEKARENKLREAFELYAEVFRLRLSSIRKTEEEFTLFYRYQLAQYLSKKKRYYLSLPEGDMISDLIVKSYDCFMEEVEESVIKLSDKGRRNLLVSLEIDYPCQEETEEEESLIAVSK